MEVTTESLEAARAWFYANTQETLDAPHIREVIKSLATFRDDAIPDGAELVPSDVLETILEQALDDVWLGDDKAYQWAMQRTAGDS